MIQEKTYTKERLLAILKTYEDNYGELPTRRELNALYGVSENPFRRVFGGWQAALDYYEQSKVGAVAKEEPRKVKDGLLEELGKRLNEKELKAVVESTRVNTSVASPIKTPVTGHFKALVFSDTHCGHSKFREDWYFSMLDHAVDEGCDWAWLPGDILEGMSGRPGHVYELSQIGFEAQFAKAVELFDACPFPIRGITGNHDLWYTGKGDIGLNVGKRLQEALPDKFIFLGDEEADEVVAGIKVKLWHGNDGASYALSYRGQKIVESLTGGDKPHILLAGHAHKAVYFETRNVQVIESGTLCSQTGFMRGKKLAAHTGYWILEVWTNENGLERIKPEWNPFYV